jgi:hypothetical protein
MPAFRRGVLTQARLCVDRGSTRGPAMGPQKGRLRVRARVHDVCAGFEVDLDVQLDRSAAHRAIFDVVLMRRAAFVHEDVDPFSAVGASGAVHVYYNALVKTVRGRAGPA